MSPVVAAILKQAAASGVELEPYGDDLRYRASEGLSPELRAELALHKTEILEALRQIDRCPNCQEPIAGGAARCGACAAALHGWKLPPAAWNGLPRSVSDWPEEWRAAYEERAAIMEFDGGLPRGAAEQRAETLVRAEHKARHR
ncbi:MAG: hypothetical protein O2782_03790 [bacterium]|nr:hypothetical protein [bacterium]